ncbi:MAG: DEAD/DEAH box helicase [Christensenellales bacterium]|jgi:superfamily II DNA or RNA helicase
MQERSKRLVDAQALLDVAQGVLPEGSAFVLMPVLRLMDGAISLSLKAGETRYTYIRDIPAFLKALSLRQPYPVSKSFIYSPTWMRLDAPSQALLEVLEAHLQTLAQGEVTLLSRDRRDLPLTDGLFKLLLKSLSQMRFILIRDGAQTIQEGICEGGLPLLFRLGYDIRGVILIGSWQDAISPLCDSGEYALIGDTLVSLSVSEAALLRVLPILPQGEEFTFHFSRSQTPRVFAELLPFLQYSQAVVMEEALQERLHKHPLKTKVYLDREGNGIAARVAFSYGEWTADPFQFNQNLPAYLLRDAQGERQVMDLLARYGFRARTGRADLQQTDLIFEFLMKGVSELHRLGEVYLSQAFRQLTPRAPGLSAHLRMRSGRISLELADQGQPSEEMLALMQALSSKKRYFRYKNGAFITLDDAREWQNLADAYLDSVRYNDEDSRDLPAMRAHYLAALAQQAGLPVTMDEGVRSAVELNPTQLDSPVSGLFDYQLRGFRWIAALHMLGLGGILADEMGLGKTAQMIAAIEYFVRSEPVRLPSLIVAPTTLLYNWQSEIERFAPGLRATVITGSRALREKTLEEALHEEGEDVIITSYPLLRQDIVLYEKIRFRFAVLDEAQNIKNFTSQTARTAKRLNAHTRLALTGTPMENNVTELWSLFDFVMPGYLYSAREFIKRYEDGRHADELRMRIRPFLMRRLKADVMAELPDKLTTTLYCEMGQEQRRVYQAALLQGRSRVHHLLDEKGLDGSRIEVLAAITQLRQICCHPVLALEDYTGESAKLELLMDLLPEALRNGRYILLFSQFTSMLRIIRTRLDEAGIPSLYLDGETSAQERIHLVERFNRGQAPVFLISLKAGGTGLNLTRADMVVHYDPWWNPTAEDQANDRAHRLGQERTVQIFHLINRKSIEEAVVDMGRRKRRLFDRLITPGELMPQKLSREDVLKLFER